MKKYFGLFNNVISLLCMFVYGFCLNYGKTELGNSMLLFAIYFKVCAIDDKE